MRWNRRQLMAAGVAALAAPALARAQGAFDGAETTPDQIWDPEAQSFLSVPDLIGRLVEAPIILLGERHGFAPHQDRAAFLLKALADRGRYPTLALEMLEPAQEKVIARYRARNPEYARRLGVALDWANTGWPDWSFYEPIFDAAFAAKLGIIGADVSTAIEAALDAGAAPERPVSAEAAAAWVRRVEAAHCGLIDATDAKRLAIKQVVRDRHMAARVQSAAQDNPDGAVLITGRNHATEGVGVPRHLDKQNLAIISFAGVSESRDQSGLVWLTPDAEDPCARFKD